MLHRYWFQFEISLDDGAPPGTIMGCGVTAYDLEDALDLLKSKVFEGDPPFVKSVEIDVDISDFDPGHVQCNMGVVSNRGVWFPLGYE